VDPSAALMGSGVSPDTFLNPPERFVVAAGQFIGGAQIGGGLVFSRRLFFDLFKEHDGLVGLLDMQEGNRQVIALFERRLGGHFRLQAGRPDVPGFNQVLFAEPRHERSKELPGLFVLHVIIEAGPGAQGKKTECSKTRPEFHQGEGSEKGRPQKQGACGPFPP
jgi:hypothetical protein